MPSRVHLEESFETVVVEHLLTHGYRSLISASYDKETALFPTAALDWIRTSQPQAWKRLEKLHGPGTDAILLADLARWCDSQGSLAVLRGGFKCYGIAFQMAAFAPAHKLNEALEKRVEENIFGVTRQLRYSKQNDNELDLTLSLNGIPLATLELKNPFTGTTTLDAEKQYRRSRDPRDRLFEFKRRTLVHFALDTETVAMTTRLAGDGTFFLPFNQGDEGGAGNPPHPSGHKTAYLWEKVLEKRSWLDILARFVHLQRDEKRDGAGRKTVKETLIFPRYHQLEAVRELEAAAKQEGPGHAYLVDHSAGSGKSNTLGWLAHRLASLHDKNDARVFDSVIVVTDRVVLDRQLQDTIYQFEHRQGVVQKIDKDTRQLVEALESRVPIVITTLQKFAFVSDALLKRAQEKGETSTGLLPTRQIAVIIDEAHSSQGGDASTDLKSVLGGEELAQKPVQEAEEAGESQWEKVYRSMAKRGQPQNLSIFAFTATPKYKTLAIFGRGGAPFHRYTMRQAIEEGFILDVLKFYTTYDTFFRLAKAGADDPNVERKKAARALSHYLKLHEENIAQKVAVILEHFHTFTRHKIGGRAKAMIVTDSRLAAVTYKLKIDAEIRARGWANEIKTLVAFSGEVRDPKTDAAFTEEQMNGGIREKELPERFAEAEFSILLVAEKYQTGFDQPLLHSMYVDKRLAGIQAVQTLSRLNRIHPDKEDTFVLDFRNTRDEIFDAFKAYYEGAQMGQSVEPSRLYELAAELDVKALCPRQEVEAFAAIFFAPKAQMSASDHAKMSAALDPAVSRFKKWREDDEAEAEEARKQLMAFLNLYAYLSQIIPFGDTDLEKLSAFGRHLAPRLPRRNAGDAYAFDDDVRLEYYRLQKIAEGSIDLRAGQAMALRGPLETGTGETPEEFVALSTLISDLNDRLGTDFTAVDRLFFEQIVEAATGDEGVQDAARANTRERFDLVAQKLLDGFFVERMERNEEQTTRFLTDEEFRAIASDHIIAEIYRRLGRDKEEK